MLPNAAGRMVEEWWQELGRKFEAVDPDTFVVMPNHIHGILMNEGADEGAHAGAPLPEIVQWFKTMTTNEYIQNVKERGWPRFKGRLWQRGYYERVIRDERELRQAREYIVGNPAKWSEDAENPVNRPSSPHP